MEYKIINNEIYANDEKLCLDVFQIKIMEILIQKNYIGLDEIMGMCNISDIYAKKIMHMLRKKVNISTKIYNNYYVLNKDKIDITNSNAIQTKHGPIFLHKELYCIYYKNNTIYVTNNMHKILKIFTNTNKCHIKDASIKALGYYDEYSHRNISVCICSLNKLIGNIAIRRNKEYVYIEK